MLGVNPGLVHEQRVVEIQKDLEKVLDKAKSYDLSKDEIRDLFDILMEERHIMILNWIVNLN